MDALITVTVVGWLMNTGLIAFSVLTVHSLVIEKEIRAVKRFLFLSLPAFFVWSVLLVLNYSYKIWVLGLAEVSICVVGVLMIMPVKRKEKFELPLSAQQYDERDIMFARARYKEGTYQYDDYYSRNPGKKDLDDRMRAMPNLCSPGTTTYHPINAPMAEANFILLDDIRKYAEGQPLAPKAEVDSNDMTRKLKGLTYYYGAKLVGVTRLKKDHFYSHIGRREEEYGKEVVSSHIYAIAFAVEMDYYMVKSAPKLPVTLESSKEYVEAAKIALQLAYYIRSLGYDARAHIDGNYLVIAPLVAASAGLGEIGRMGILMTEKYGPRVRLGVVTTDMPLVEDQPVDLGMQDFCRICRKCSQNCPSGAIPDGEKTEDRGVLKWKVNQEKCYWFWRKVGTDCAICMNTCPYSKPDTPVHRLMRFSIRNSHFARKVALIMDDYLYGKRPYSTKQPSWM